MICFLLHVSTNSLRVLSDGQGPEDGTENSVKRRLLSKIIAQKRSSADCLARLLRKNGQPELKVGGAGGGLTEIWTQKRDGKNK